MKLTLALLALALPLVTSQCLVENPDYASFEAEGCDLDSFVRGVRKQRNALKLETGATNCLSKEDELSHLLGFDGYEGNEAAIELKVESICDEALSRSANDSNYGISFESIELIDSSDTEEINRFIKEFFDGGTYYNEQIQQRAGGGENFNLNAATQGIKSFYKEWATKSRVKWPSTEISNFRQCEANAAMCCWVQDRQAGDDNGNCETPYPLVRIISENLWTPDNCIDKDPADNTDICYVDMSRSPQSNHVKQGVVIYDDKPGVREGDAHCHGFAWADDSLSDSKRYMGNNLFFVSMYDHLRARGYVREVPGAPMCGCVEQMPTVTRSDCTEVEVTEFFSLEYEDNANTYFGTITSANVNFNACQGLNGNNNNLQAYYDRLVEEGKIQRNDKFEEILVGDDNCGPVVEEVLDSYGIERA